MTLATPVLNLRILPKIRAVALSSTLTLVACGGEDAAIERPEGCALHGGNLIQDPDFSTLSAPTSERRWRASEHAAGGTFEASADNGVLSIRKIGKEPWFIVAQSPDTTALAGKRLSFSAEVKLDLHEPRHAHNLGYGGGLAVLARRGGKITLTSNIEHEPNFGVHDWQLVEVVFQLPKNTTYLRLGLLHQAGGSMQVRNPALHEVDPACPVTIGNNSSLAHPGRPSGRDRLSLGQ